MKSIKLDSLLCKQHPLDIPFKAPIVKGDIKFSSLLPVGGFQVIHSKIYISGPVTGKENHNIEQFKEAEVFLRSCGFEVWNPLEIQLPEVKFSKEELWQYCMHFCVRAIPLCDSMLMLPDWQNSKGAVQEHRIAQMLGLAIYYSPVL